MTNQDVEEQTLFMSYDKIKYYFIKLVASCMNSIFKSFFHVGIE